MKKTEPQKKVVNKPEEQIRSISCAQRRFAEIGRPKIRVMFFSHEQEEEENERKTIKHGCFSVVDGR